MATRSIESYRNGVLIGTTQYTVPNDVIVRESLSAKAIAAISANNTYLAIANPTAAQTTAQVQRLSRECNALIRMLLGQLDSDDA